MAFDHTSRRDSVLLFLIGCFSLTQINIVGYIGISEFVMALAAPFVIFKNYDKLRIHGFRPVLYLGIAWLISAYVSDTINQSHYGALLRGIATPYVVIATIVCVYALAHKNVTQIRWLIFGVACSSILSIYVFQPGTAISYGGGYSRDSAEAMERVLNYKLFWVIRATLWLPLVIQMAYLKVPVWISVGITAFLAYFSLMEGGRSVFLVMVMSMVIIIIGRNKVETMKRIKRHIMPMVIMLIVVLAGTKSVYEFAAKHGYMGEKEATKYEKQMEGKSSLLKILMSGRGEFFIGLYAVMDKPFLGHGSWAFDHGGYHEKFLEKFGSGVDYEQDRRRQLLGISNIPAHSHLIGFWLWHGLAGGLFWAYVLWLIWKMLRFNMAVVPELYGYLALAIPMAVWNILFSPFGMRTSMCCLITTCLLIRSIANKSSRYVLDDIRDTMSVPFPEGRN